MEGSLPHREEGCGVAAPHPRTRAWRAVCVVTGLGLSAALAWGVPPLLRDLFHGVGRAVCHQWPAHSLFLGGWQLPLCARCTGTFLGAAVSLLALVWRGRARTGNLPPAGILAALVCFVAAWAVDGMNSFLSLFPGAPHPYAPSNPLRLATGLLNGTALVHLALPVVNLTLWRDASPDPSLRSWKELGGLLAVLAGCGALVLWGPGWLYGPVAFWSILGVVALLTLVNAVIATVLLGREGAARSARELAVPLAAAILLTALEVAAIVALRTWLEARVGLGW
ncbi:MAG: DUF2085 domain-containing protein [Anaerolineae bacterium]|nr:DUF2085 domain-containing protein [Anaerolineae bacterium]